ncbi:hypothetical protein BC628DRAFT_706257 [Trametes gibbosa]|nr:hypothetical protein BC628DRAFT_706257 [Trametes gibbosa]
MSATSMIPGYKQVEGFGPDEDYESGEEIEYVTLDLGTIEPTLVPSSSTYRLIGLDTPTPYLQLSGTKLKGLHQALLGTELLFMESSDEHQTHTQGKKPLVPVASTERRIRFREIELKPKGTEGESSYPAVPTVSTTKANTVAKKVKTQMDHVIGTPSGPSRRGRGSSKRGGTTKSQAWSKGKTRAEDPPAEQCDPAAADVIDPALTQMDTSEG